MYRWKCTYCDEVVRGATVDDVKSVGRSHLRRTHRRELEPLFREKWAGNDCQGGCGSWFPVDDSRWGFECPDCGHDHFAYFAGAHVWSGIEEAE